MPTFKGQSPFKLPETCLYCKEVFRKEDIDLIDEVNGNSVFHLTCSRCQTSFVFHLVVGPEGVLSIGTVTDASKEDLDKLKRGENVTADDVISAYLETKKVNNGK